jgi:hypothetical protein
MSVNTAAQAAGMKSAFNTVAIGDRDDLLDALAAELTSAAYRIALRHGTGDSWIELELGLWQALSETVRKWGRGLPRPDKTIVRPHELRNGLVSRGGSRRPH